MKTFGSVLGCALLLLPFGAGAQAPGRRHSAEFSWGLSVPVGDAFTAKTGTSALSLRYEYRLLPVLGIGASIGIDNHSENGWTTDRVDGSWVSGNSDRTIKLLPLLATVRYYPLGGGRTLLRPYVGAGLGAQWAQMRLTGEAINTAQADRWGLGAAVEAGVRIHPLDRLPLFVDVRCAYRYGGNAWSNVAIESICNVLPSIGIGMTF